MHFTLSVIDIVYAAILALIFTWLINIVTKFIKIVLSRSTEINFNPRNVEAVMARCCSMFPNELVSFNGDTFRRGMWVRVTTMQNKIIEGQFVGINDDNMACFVTEQSVFAQELDKIEEIHLMES